MKTSLQLRKDGGLREDDAPSEMAFMFSRAAWADLKGKKAARLTMLLNLPMFRTLSSTWKAAQMSTTRVHGWVKEVGGLDR